MPYDKKNFDLIDVLRKETGYGAKRIGAWEFLEHCPFCGNSRKRYKHFAVQVETSWAGKCFRCGKMVDAAAAIMELRCCTFKEATAHLQGESWLETFAEQKPYPKQKPTGQEAKNSQKRQQLVRYIWQNSRPASKEEILALLAKRHFPKNLIEPACSIVAGLCRINTYQDREMLVIPQIMEHSEVLSGLSRIWLADPHLKGDLGQKGYTFLPGRADKPHIIYEGFLTAMGPAALRYNAIVIHSCTNKKALAAAISAYKDKNPLFWLDRGAEMQQWEYCRQYGLSGIWFEADKPNGYDVNDLLRDTGEKFADYVEKYLEKAGDFPPYPIYSPELREPDAARIAASLSILDVAEALGYDVAASNEMSCPTDSGEVCRLYPEVGYGQCACAEGIHDIADLYAKSRGIQTWKAVGHSVATLFSDLLFPVIGGFPILFPYGKHGTGKSRNSAWSAAMTGTHTIPPFNIGSTVKSYQRIGEKYRNAIVRLNEYRSNDINNALLCALFDREGYRKAQKSMGLDTVEGEINASYIVISTQSIIGNKSEDVASRLIELNFNDAVIDAEAFNWMEEHIDDLTCMVPFIFSSLTREGVVETVKRDIDTVRRLINGPYEDRILKTHVAIWSCYNQLLLALWGEDCLNEQMPTITIDQVAQAIIGQTKITQAADLGMTFLKILISMVRNERISINSAVIRTSLLPEGYEGDETEMLIFSLVDVLPLVRAQGKAAEIGISDEKTIANALRSLGCEKKTDRALGRTPRKLWFYLIDDK